MSFSVLQDIIDRSLSGAGSPAAKDLDRELTYGQLIDEAARLGAGLRTRGVVEGDRVALLIPNSVEFLVAALASMWVGAIFVPLAVTDPLSRLETIVTDCSPTLVVAPTSEDLPDTLGDVTMVSMESLFGETSVAKLEGDESTRVAYMIYTSGTTGTPKGVEVGNAAFLAAVRSTADALGLSSSTTTLCVSPFHFDGSYANLFPTLIRGGAVVIRPREALLFPRTFFNTVDKEAINYSGFTPSYLRLLLASPQISVLEHSSLEVIALGGEAISFTDLQALWARAPSLRVFNRYGPTESAIAVTNVELTPEMVEGGVVTMGRPHPGVSFVLADEDGRVIGAANRIGELYIGGVQLMDGYWGNEDVTSAVMRRDVVAGETLYRTGDLAYRDERGDYFYVDRIDRVVKRSGVRISLVELSASMNKLSEVAAAVCVTFDHDGELGIAAFVTTEGAVSALDLRRAASHFVPETMLPDRFEVVSAMPLNKSNQLDESQLLASAGLQPFRPVSAKP